ncbi:RidA family protein [Actinomadura sp. 9N215]|uniref:RidA family protein n=1 Tax=Actinomadura sp. 9N215 TaxID=3375150 RepID=UPI00379AF146
MTEPAAISRQRIIVNEDGRPYPGVPIISQVVAHGDTVYLSGVVSDPINPTGDVRFQTREVLRQIDQLLGSAGTSKSRLLTAQVWLADMSMFAEHNDVWNEWVDAANPPARACVQAHLFRPDLLVEIMVTAAR